MQTATKQRGRRALASFLLAGVAGALFVWPWYVIVRQERLNRGLILKVREGDVAGVMRQLARGADPNARAYDDTRMTPQCFLQMLQHSLTRRTPATCEPTALFVAVYHPHPEIIAALLRAGAQPDVRDTYSRTPLIFAAYRGWARNVRALLDGKPDINSVDAEGRTALMGASVLGYQEEADMLLARGAKPNLKTQFGRTALMWASGFHYPLIVRLLLQKGADANTRDNKNVTALQQAKGKGYPDLIAALQLAGAKP